MMIRGLFWFCIIFLAKPIFGSSFAITFGPPSLGRGGSNPISLPPRVVDTGLTYVADSLVETQISVTGLLVGIRENWDWGGFVSLGGGLVISANGSGFGFYTNFGAEFLCGWVCLQAVYTAGLGFAAGNKILNPYAVRVGGSYKF